MRIAVTGSSGLIGSALVPALRDDGHDIVRLVRSEPADAHEVRWDPTGGQVDTAGLEGVDAVVHLAGEKIAGLWTKNKKQKIRDSRVIGTRTLAEALARMQRPPAVLISTSAIGIYGPDNGDTPLDESAPAGEGFLADVGRQWEAAADPARQAGMRVVHPRVSMVVTGKGGALGAMLPVFKLGLGGVVGSGEQYWSWVALPDLVRAYQFVLNDDRADGPVNVTAPQPVTSRAFTEALGRQLRRPTVFPLPRFGARLIFGEMADEVLLASARVIPSKLEKLGFTFDLPGLPLALDVVLRDDK